MLPFDNLKVTFSQRWMDQQTDKPTNGQLELLRAAKNLTLMGGCHDFQYLIISPVGIGIGEKMYLNI